MSPAKTAQGSLCAASTDAYGQCGPCPVRHARLQAALPTLDMLRCSLSSRQCGVHLLGSSCMEVHAALRLACCTAAGAAISSAVHTKCSSISCTKHPACRYVTAVQLHDDQHDMHTGCCCCCCCCYAPTAALCPQRRIHAPAALRCTCCLQCSTASSQAGLSWL